MSESPSPSPEWIVGLRQRLAFFQDTLWNRCAAQRSADDSARPAFTVDVPTREVDGTIKILAEAADALREQAAEIDHLAADIEADRLRKAALQDSIDGCAQKVLSMKAEIDRLTRELAVWQASSSDALAEVIGEVRTLADILRARPEQSAIDAAHEVILALDLAETRREQVEADNKRLTRELAEARGPLCPCGFGAEPWHQRGICQQGWESK